MYLYSQHTGTAPITYTGFYWKIYSYVCITPGSSGSEGSCNAYLQVQQNGKWNTIAMYGDGTNNGACTISKEEYIASVQNNVTGARIQLRGGYWINNNPSSGSTATNDGKIYEFKAYANPVCEYVNSSGNVPPSVSQPAYPSSGTFESNVIELNALELDKISWSQTTPSGTQITFQTRTGNTAAPDNTWSGWSSPMADPAGSLITSPTSKYLQYRINMSTSDTTVTPKIIIDGTHAISISYSKFSGSLSDVYVKVKENNATKAYNGSGILIWEEDALGNRTTYNPSNPQGTIDLSSLAFDSAALNTLKEALPAYKLSDAQKVITIYDKGNDLPVEIVNAGQSISYFNKGLATKVVDKSGTTLVAYTYDEGDVVVKVNFVDARQKLQESYDKALSEIVTEKTAALAKLAKAEADARAQIAVKSADMQLQIDAERERITREKSQYDPAIYDLSVFAEAFAQLDDYQAKLNKQKIDASNDITNQVAAARARIEQDARTAMQNLIDNDYNKILADIVQKESTPLIYQYYREILGRDPGNDDLLYWTNFAKTNLRMVYPLELIRYLEGLPEYVARRDRKQNIINALSAFFTQYLSASLNGKETMLAGLGITASEAVALTQDDINIILAYLGRQPFHFGDSAFEAVISMLKSSGINKSFYDIGKDALKIDILTGVITMYTTGDLVISMFAMRNAAKANGLTLYAEKLTYNDLKDKVLKNNVIVHIDGKHYVIVKSIDDSKGTITYMDPTIGPSGQDITLSRAEFMESWKGYAISKEPARDESKHINATREKNIRGSGWWENFWKGVVGLFQNIVAPVAVVLLMIPSLAPIGAVLLGINIVVQTISFVVHTGTLMDVAWSVVTAIGAAIGSQILPNIMGAASKIFSSIGHAIFAPLQGVFSSVMPIFNILSTAVTSIATGIGQIISLGAAATPQIAASIGYNVITQGISLGTSFMFKTMNLDPTLSNIGSALLTTAITGAIIPNTDIVAGKS